MLSVNFKNVGSSEGKYNMQDVFLGGGNENTPFKADQNVANADQIQVYYSDGAGSEGYTTYYLFNTTKTTPALVAKKFWWVDTSANKAENVYFKNGDTVWFLNRSTSPVSFTVSGEVDITPVNQVNILPGYNMIGNCFPMGWNVNAAPYDTDYWQNSGAKSDQNIANADQIQVFANDGKGGEGYTTYYLFNTTKTTPALVAKKFKWVDTSANIAEGDILQAGGGAWYLHRGDGFKLDMKNPLAK